VGSDRNEQLTPESRPDADTPGVRWAGRTFELDVARDSSSILRSGADFAAADHLATAIGDRAGDDKAPSMILSCVVGNDAPKTVRGLLNGEPINQSLGAGTGASPAFGAVATPDTVSAVSIVIDLAPNRGLVSHVVTTVGSPGMLPPGDAHDVDEMMTAEVTGGEGESGDPNSGDDTTHEPPIVGAINAPEGARRVKTAGRMLAIWVALVIDLNSVLWLSGVKTLALHQAVEQGVARAESRAVGEVSDALIRKAIRNQRGTLTFWTTLALIVDFVAEPLALVVRALVVATLLSALAAMVGRPNGFRLALNECATVQGFWVLGLAAQVALIIALRTTEVETSLALVLPAGTYPALLWVALRQADAFALLGWAALIRGGWRRGQANVAIATGACALVALCELTCRVGFALITGSAMRLMVMPYSF